MDKKITLTKWAADSAGVSVRAHGISIHAELYGGTSNGILLYDRENEKPVRIDFTEDMRLGSTYRCLLSGVSSQEYDYLFHEDGEPVVDIYAKRLVGHRLFGTKHQDAGRKDALKYCSFVSDQFDWRGDKRPGTAYENSIYYGLHVRGFTRDNSSGIKEAGTFAGVQKKIPYLKKLGVTGVVMQPVYEFEECMKRPEGRTVPDAAAPQPEITPVKLNYWGYLPGYYMAPKNAYAYGEDAVTELKTLVRQLHRNGLEIIMQFYFETSMPASRIRSILLYWAEHYHIDGLRVDAVASMLYLDYGKQDGQWVANKYGDNKNLEAIELFKHINTLILGRNPGAMMIAEESTAWPKVTGPVEEDGLNFSYKWNMGWMHDFLDYMKLDPYFRKNNHHKMTFAMSYNEYEKYILVLSHDEVVHLKCSMLNKMPGLGIDKFRNLMVAYAFMMGHPGKKLLFMGQEFAQLQEWSEERELDWYLLENPDHLHVQNWMKELLHIYQKNPALYELDSSWDGFEWMNANDADRSIFSFVRKSKDGKNNLLFVCNFTPMERADYRVGVPKRKAYKLILNSDDEQFGGSGQERPLSYRAVKKECDGKMYSFAYPLTPYGVAVFRF